MLDNSSSTSPGGRMDTPYVTISLPVVSSTQDEARERFAGVPLLVTAGRQTAGRGRRGTPWLQADRAVAASLAFRPPWPPEARSRLTLLAGLAARAALGGKVALAWPNDLVRGEQKVGGLIAEASAGVVVAGFGLNLFWADPIPGAGALLEADPGPAEADPIAAAWAADLLRRVEEGPDAWGIDEYRECSATLGTEVSWDPGGRGRAVDITPDGGLVVEGPAGIVVLRAGEVRRVTSRPPDGPSGGGYPHGPPSTGSASP
jgi:BirA family biotin operon repressor/biotin-[acetyl-CoA-carboxylase] ligase